MATVAGCGLPSAAALLELPVLARHMSAATERAAEGFSVLRGLLSWLALWLLMGEGLGLRRRERRCESSWASSDTDAEAEGERGESGSGRGDGWCENGEAALVSMGLRGFCCGGCGGCGDCGDRCCGDRRS